jgi:hypothetical protein
VIQDQLKRQVTGDVRILLDPPQGSSAITPCPSCQVAISAFRDMFGSVELQIFGKDANENVYMNLTLPPAGNRRISAADDRGRKALATLNNQRFVLLGGTFEVLEVGK